MFVSPENTLKDAAFRKKLICQKPI